MGDPAREIVSVRLDASDGSDFWATMFLPFPSIVQAGAVVQFFAHNGMAIADREFVDEDLRVQRTAATVDANDLHCVPHWPIPADALTEDQLTNNGNIEIEPTDGMPEQTLP